ncbi:MAG: hypothetical protein AAFS13_01245 [Pseudomonadota bacterium]
MTRKGPAIPVGEEIDLSIDIPPDQKDAYADALERGSLNALKAVLIASASDSQRQWIEAILPEDLTASNDDESE